MRPIRFPKFLLKGDFNIGPGVPSSIWQFIIVLVITRLERWPLGKPADGSF